MARSRRPKPGTQGLQRGHLPPPAARPELLQDRRPRRDRDPDPQLLRLHEGAARGQRGLHGDGDVRQRHDAARDSPGADRRRQRRQGHERRAPTATTPRSRSPSITRACRCTTTRRSRSGRASSSRATTSSTCGPAARARPTCPTAASIPVTRTATAVQLDEVLTALQRPTARTSALLLDGYGSALADKPTAEEGHRAGPRRAVATPAPRRSTSPSTTAGAPARPPRRSARRSSASRPGDLRGLIKASGSVFQQLASRESAAQRPDHELLGHHRRLRRRVGQPRGDAARSSRRRSSRRRRQLAEINAAFPPLRAFARELTPGVKELPATIEAGTPVAASRPTSCCRRTSSAESSRDLRDRDADALPRAPRNLPACSPSSACSAAA